MSADNISIGEWAEEVIKEIQDFADCWNVQRESAVLDSNETIYPERMNRDDWDEHFDAWRSK